MKNYFAVFFLLMNPGHVSMGILSRHITITAQEQIVMAFSSATTYLATIDASAVPSRPTS